MEVFYEKVIRGKLALLVKTFNGFVVHYDGQDLESFSNKVYDSIVDDILAKEFITSCVVDDYLTNYMLGVS